MDPFLGAANFQDTGVLDVIKSKIHIRFQKNGNRSITLIEGLDEDLDQKRIARALKKALQCASSVHEDKLHGEVIKLQGDHCQAVKEWLIAQEILSPAEAKDRLVIHGA